MLKPVVVTRAEPPGGPLSRELEARGLAVLRWPAIAIEPVDPTPLTQALHEAIPFDWIVLTSRHGVAALAAVLPAAPGGVRIAAVGPATAAALRERGWPVELSADEAGAEGLLKALERRGLRGQRVLHPTSSRALPSLSEGLARLGAEVVSLEAYRTVAGASLDTDACRAAIDRRSLGAVTFASPSAATELEHALGTEYFRQLLRAAPAVAIGPTTARALSARGFSPFIAEPHTLRGLALCCEALVRGIQAGSPAADPEHQAALRAEKRLTS